VVDAFDLAQLQRVDRQAGVAIASEPGTVVLVVHLVAVADSVLLHPSVAADVEDGRQGLLACFVVVSGQVEIPGDVETGAGLELEVFDDEVRVVDSTGDDRLEWCFFRSRREPEHFEELFSILATLCLPVVERLDICQAAIGQSSGFGPEVGVDGAIAC